jgi:hypothetical protein
MLSAAVRCVIALAASELLLDCGWRQSPDNASMDSRAVALDAGTPVTDALAIT